MTTCDSVVQRSLISFHSPSSRSRINVAYQFPDVVTTRSPLLTTRTIYPPIEVSASVLSANWRIPVAHHRFQREADGIICNVISIPGSIFLLGIGVRCGRGDDEQCPPLRRRTAECPPIRPGSWCRLAQSAAPCAVCAGRGRSSMPKAAVMIGRACRRARRALSTASGSPPAPMYSYKGRDMDTRSMYLDMQATTPMDPRVLDAMMPYLTEQYGNPHSTTHLYGWETSAAVEKAREQVAGVINADPKEIIFTSGATESNNALIKGGSAACALIRSSNLIGWARRRCTILRGTEAAHRDGPDGAQVRPGLVPAVAARRLRRDLPAGAAERPHRPGGARGGPHGQDRARLRHVRQQRDRRQAADRGDRRDVPGPEGCHVPDSTPSAYRADSVCACVFRSTSTPMRHRRSASSLSMSTP